MRVLELLRAVFGKAQLPPHNYVESGSLFPQLDLDRMRQRLRLEELGQRRSTNHGEGQPDGFDDIENRIVTEIQAEAGRARENLGRHLRGYGDRLAALKISTYLAELVSSADRAQGDFTAQVQGGRDLLFQLQRDVTGITQEFERFKVEHRLKRLPHFPASQLWHLGIILLLVIVEAALNGSFLAKGLDLGLLGGITQALVIAVINVGVGVAAGRIIAPRIMHRQMHLKVAGLVGMAVWIGFASVFNLAVAQYRAALGGDASDAAEATAVRQLLANPLGVPDIGGWILFIMGFLFSVIAAVDGWRMDDPYPGYGSIARRREDLIEQYLAQKRQLTGLLEAIRDGALSRMDALSGALELRVEQYRTIQENRRRLLKLFRDHLKYLEQCGSELLSTYRQAGRTAPHSSPPPPAARWQLPNDVEPDPVGDSSEDPGMKTRISTAFDQLREARARIDADYQAALRAYKAIETLAGDGDREA